MKLAYFPLFVVGCMPKSQVALPSYHEPGQMQVQQALGRLATVMTALGDRSGDKVEMTLTPKDQDCSYSATWEDSEPYHSWLGDDRMHLTVTCRGEPMSASYDKDSRGIAGEIFSRVEEGLSSHDLRSRLLGKVVRKGDEIKRNLIWVYKDVMETGEVDLNDNVVKTYDDGYARLDFSLREVKGDHYTHLRGTDLTLSLDERLGIVDQGFLHPNTVLLSPGSGVDRVSYYVSGQIVDIQIGDIRGDLVELYATYNLIAPELEDWVKEQKRKN